MSGIVEVPVEMADDNAPTEPVEAIQEEYIPEAVEAVEKAVAKPKAKMGRPVGKKDTKVRAKPKPKPKARVQEAYMQERAVEPDTESSSEDEASLQELHALRLMRAVRSYDQSRLQRKTDQYASWFGR